MRREGVFIAVILALVGSILYLGFRQGPTPSFSQQPDRERVLFVRYVIDGDTIILSDGSKIRLIGIDTPELHYSKKLLRDSRRSARDIRTIQEMGRRAMEFTKKACLGKEVRLEFDVERRDRYKRTLAYVYLKDGAFLNEEIIKAGYAQTMTIPPNVKYADLFLRSEREARNEKRGLWREE